jgi:hypothetical protein
VAAGDGQMGSRDGKGDSATGQVQSLEIEAAVARGEGQRVSGERCHLAPALRPPV